MKRMMYGDLQVTCPDCEGTGIVWIPLKGLRGAKPYRCDNCHGSGKLYVQD